MEENFDLSRVTEAEKIAILRVLKRNEELKEREERRLQQLAVRVQMERKEDGRSIEDESRLIGKTGLWHKIVRDERFPSDLPDAGSSLFDRITSDLVKAGRKTSKVLTSSQRSSIDDITNERYVRELPTVESWVAEQAMHNDVFKPERSLESLCTVKYRGNESRQLTLTISHEEGIQREI